MTLAIGLLKPTGFQLCFLLISKWELLATQQQHLCWVDSQGSCLWGRCCLQRPLTEEGACGWELQRQGLLTEATLLIFSWLQPQFYRIWICFSDPTRVPLIDDSPAIFRMVEGRTIYSFKEMNPSLNEFLPSVEMGIGCFRRMKDQNNS